MAVILNILISDHESIGALNLTSPAPDSIFKNLACGQRYNQTRILK